MQGTSEILQLTHLRANKTIEAQQQQQQQNFKMARNVDNYTLTMPSLSNAKELKEKERNCSELILRLHVSHGFNVS